DPVGAEEGELQRLLPVLHAPVHAQLNEVAPAFLHEHVVGRGAHGRHSRTPPSTLTATSSRTPPSTSMSWTVGSTAATGTPACFWSTRLAAPVPPQPSEMWSRLAPALTPPMHAISTPCVATNLSAARTSGLRCRQLSTISLTSSIE